MTFFELLAYIWLGSAAFFGFKAVWDQYQLLKLYRKIVNPPYPIVPGEPLAVSSMLDDPLGLEMTKHQFKIMFSKHSKHPRLAKQARKVRIEWVTSLAIGVGGFFFIGALVFGLHAILTVLSRL